jgi:hypothetical protein
MNFFKEYNKLEHLYIKSGSSQCFIEMSTLFAEFLNQVIEQIRLLNK